MAGLLQTLGVAEVEIAPLRAVTDPGAPDPAQAAAYRQFWQGHGIQIRAMQALLFGCEGAALFEDAAQRQRLVARLTGVIELAARLGARRLVFGSPGQRKRGSRVEAELAAIATEVFGGLGHLAARDDICLCIEPNPPVYGCDWVTTASEGAAIVRAVGEPGFGLHLDTAGMWLAGDDGPQAVSAFMDVLRHVHLSAPQLGPVQRGGDVSHGAVLSALAAAGYDQTVSIEMRALAGESNLPQVAEALGYVQSLMASFH